MTGMNVFSAIKRHISSLSQIRLRYVVHLLEDVVHVPDLDGSVNGGGDDRVPAADGQRLDVNDPVGDGDQENPNQIYLRKLYNRYMSSKTTGSSNLMDS